MTRDEQRYLQKAVEISSGNTQFIMEVHRSRGGCPGIGECLWRDDEKRSERVVRDLVTRGYLEHAGPSTYVCVTVPGMDVIRGLPSLATQAADGADDTREDTARALLEVFAEENGELNRDNVLGHGSDQGLLAQHLETRFDATSRARANKVFEELDAARFIEPTFTHAKNPRDWYRLAGRGREALAGAKAGRRLLPDPEEADRRGAVPTEIRDSLEAFRRAHPDATKVAFVMMRFGNDATSRAIHAAVGNALAGRGIQGLRADDKAYHEDLYWNVVTYMHGCARGIAIFHGAEPVPTFRLLARWWWAIGSRVHPQRRREAWNPNVSLEAGYMMGLGKAVCFLKDRTVDVLQTDLIGKLYKSFDAADAAGTIPERLREWLDEPAGEVSPAQ
jgi:hypothetical protein